MITKSIYELETKVDEVFSKHGFSEVTRHKKILMIRNLLRLHEEQGEGQISKAIVDEYVKHQELRYRKGEIGRCTLNKHKSAAEALLQINATGALICKRRTRLSSLSESFEGILADILANEEKSLKSRKEQLSRVRGFFRWLSDRGHTDLSHVGERTVREYFADCSKIMVGRSLNAVRSAIKELFIFVSQDGVLPEPMHKLFLFKIPVEKRIMPFMPADEIAAVLNVIDRTTAKGKRDYAFILLAAMTGLRGCDIAELCLDSIDWRNGEIRIVQEKTWKALALPLTTDVAEAVRDYILNARPASESNKVFLITKAPYNGLKRNSLNNALQSYRAKAGLTVQRGFHSLRRWFATNMVTSGVSVITVSQALGQSKTDSAKPYISLDSKNLKECALDFSGIQVGGDM
jgi:integrase